jgi:hypothetical protein
MFSLEPISSREASAIYFQSLKRSIKAEFIKKPKRNTIAVGSVDYCLQILPKLPDIIDFYPAFLAGYFGRNITLRTKEEVGPGLFIKSATSFKRFEPFITSGSTALEDDMYWCSEVVDFINEWRYYIAEGREIASGWYSGCDENACPPKLNIDWPNWFSGAVDFGVTDSGLLLLVESHLPFACGWYGENGADYMEWLITSWKAKSWYNAPSHAN